MPSEPTTNSDFAVPTQEFTTETHFEDNDDDVFELRQQQENITDADGTSTHHSRRKRQILVPANHLIDNNAYTMEVLVAVDRKMQEYHGQNIKAYVLTLMSIVSSIYADASIGNSINVAVVHILLLKDDLRVESNHVGEYVHYAIYWIDQASIACNESKENDRALSNQVNIDSNTDTELINVRQISHISWSMHKNSNGCHSMNLKYVVDWYECGILISSILQASQHLKCSLDSVNSFNSNHSIMTLPSYWQGN